jgi:hypothetical protein
VPSRYVETVYVDPAELRAFPGTPNRADVDELRGSVRANGQYRPVIARRLPDGALEILAGHGTTEATGAEAGKVRTEVHDVDDATARRIVARDNKRPKGSVLDEEALLALLSQAEADGGLDGTGYWEDDVDDLRALLEEADAHATGNGSRGGQPESGGEGNVTANNGLADLKDAYFGGTSRLVVLSYEGARYVWVVEALAKVAALAELDSNADAVVRLLEDATGTNAPSAGTPAPGEAANPPLADTTGLPRGRGPQNYARAGSRLSRKGGSDGVRDPDSAAGADG